MWLMALLINSNTLEEMGIIWRNICVVLLSPSQNDQFKISISTLSKMADDMNKDPDKTNFVLQNVSVTSKGQFSSKLSEKVRNSELLANFICIVQYERTRSKISILTDNMCVYKQEREMYMKCIEF